MSKNMSTNKQTNSVVKTARAGVFVAAATVALALPLSANADHGVDPVAAALTIAVGHAIHDRHDYRDHRYDRRDRYRDQRRFSGHDRRHYGHDYRDYKRWKRWNKHARKHRRHDHHARCDHGRHYWY